MQELGSRKAELQNMHVDRGQAVLEFLVPTRGLIGFRSEFLRLTKGTGVMNHAFFQYRPWCGEITGQRNGVLIAWEEGVATSLCPARRRRSRRIFHQARHPGLWRHDHW